MKSKIFYSTIKMSEFELNVCYCKVCSSVEYKRCLKIKECQERLTGCEKDKITGKLDWLTCSDKSIDKRNEKLKVYRKKEFKKCKPVKFSIERVKKGELFKND
ncbi:unnamed protein product [marine sediment metagenome]|uniref:Uncharacterized protein n=1 Tax=marine sediment metagenome TaxID=412755 RepID=X0YPX1_9ZZZZ